VLQLCQNHATLCCAVVGRMVERSPSHVVVE
jgi:hypothetical protein